MFFIDTVNFELILYYFGIVQFCRFQSLLADFFEELSVLVFGVKFSIVPKSCIKGVQEWAENAYER